MPSRAEIVSFDDSPPPAGADPWVVAGAGPGTGIEVTDPDPAWPRQYDGLAGRIREALGWRVLQLEHIGSTAVPGLAAKPIIDIDLAVAEPRASGITCRRWRRSGSSSWSASPGGTATGCSGPASRPAICMSSGSTALS